MVLTNAEKSARYRAKDVEAYRAKKNALAKLPHHKEMRRLYAKKWRDAHKKPRRPRVRKFTDEQIAERKRASSLRYRQAHREELRLISRKNYRLYREKYKNRLRTYWLRKKYGITAEQFEQRLLEQNGKCFICSIDKSSSKKNLHVDHCHATGKIRGILCHRCNTKLGWFETFKDKIEEYLGGKKSSVEGGYPE